MKLLLLFVLVIASIGWSEQKCSRAFEQQFLARHNAVRAKHGARPLQYSGQINNVAQQWANHLADSGKFEHRKNNKYGENLWTSWSSRGPPTPSGSVPVDSWYNEKKFYHWFGREPDMKRFHDWGHFSQVVWKASQRMGVGCATKGNKLVVVANYDPPGNLGRQYGRNV